MSAYEKMLDRLPATVLHVLISSTDTSGLSTLTREDMQDLLRAFDIDPRTAFAPALLKRLRTDAGDYNSAPPTDNDVNMPDSQPQITSVEVTVRPLPRVWTSSGRFDDVASPLQSLTSVGGVLFLLVDEGRLSVSRTDHEMDDLVFLNQKIMTATWTAEDLLVVSPCICKLFYLSENNLGIRD